MTEEVTEAEAAQESLVKAGCEAIVKEAVVIEVTLAETAPESPFKETEAIVEEAIVTEEVTEAETASELAPKTNLMPLWRKQL